MLPYALWNLTLTWRRLLVATCKRRSRAQLLCLTNIPCCRNCIKRCKNLQFQSVLIFFKIVHPWLLLSLRKLIGAIRHPSSDIGHPRFDIQHSPSDIPDLTSDWSDIRDSTSPDIRDSTSDIWRPTSEIRHPTSDIRHPTFDFRDSTSDIWKDGRDV